MSVRPILGFFFIVWGWLTCWDLYHFRPRKQSAKGCLQAKFPDMTTYFAVELQVRRAPHIRKGGVKREFLPVPTDRTLRLHAPDIGIAGEHPDARWRLLHIR